tara:strand:+ start:706 stop:1326 length:621 start_codon:yes stop_codon:yes gene_type:complete
MKILSSTFKRKVNCSASVCLWNHWDGDHINYTHKGIYSESEIFYEDDRVILFFHSLKVPLIPFLKISTVDMTVLKDKNTVCTYGFQFGIPSLSTAKYKDIAKDKCLVEVNYKFKFSGLKILLYPLIKYLIPKWNERTWKEDLPLKLRRQKVKRMNFKDYRGLPNKIKDRKFSGQIDFKLPISRLRKSDNKLTKHPFYNFGRKNGHI